MTPSGRARRPKPPRRGHARARAMRSGVNAWPDARLAWRLVRSASSPRRRRRAGRHLRGHHGEAPCPPHCRPSSRGARPRRARRRSRHLEEGRGLRLECREPRPRSGGSGEVDAVPQLVAEHRRPGSGLDVADEHEDAVAREGTRRRRWRRPCPPGARHRPGCSAKIRARCLRAAGRARRRHDTWRRRRRPGDRGGSRPARSGRSARSARSRAPRAALVPAGEDIRLAFDGGEQQLHGCASTSSTASVAAIGSLRPRNRSSASRSAMTASRQAAATWTFAS